MLKIFCRMGAHSYREVDLVRHKTAFVSVGVYGSECQWCGEIKKPHLIIARQLLSLIHKAPDMAGTTIIHPRVNP